MSQIMPKRSLIQQPKNFYTLGYGSLLAIVVTIIIHHRIDIFLLIFLYLLGLSCCLYANMLWVKNTLGDRNELNMDNVESFDKDILTKAKREPLIHLSALSGYIIPFANLWLPTRLWFRHKNSFSISSGFYVFNFQVFTSFLLMAACMLSVVFIGILMIPLIMMVHILLTIIMSIVASTGKNDAYPANVDLLQTWIFYTKRKKDKLAAKKAKKEAAQ